MNGIITFQEVGQIDRQYAILRNPLAWPSQVLVLDIKCPTSGLIHISHATPCNTFEWAARNFSGIANELAMPILRLWWTQHEKIITYLISKEEWKGNRSLAYNTTWATFGYIHNQCPNAILLASRIKRDRQFKFTSVSQLGTSE